MESLYTINDVVRLLREISSKLDVVTITPVETKETHPYKSPIKIPLSMNNIRAKLERLDREKARNSRLV